MPQACQPCTHRGGVKSIGRPVEREILSRPPTQHSSPPPSPTPTSSSGSSHGSGRTAGRQAAATSGGEASGERKKQQQQQQQQLQPSLKAASVPVANTYSALSPVDDDHDSSDDSEPSGAVQQQLLLSASNEASRRNTIVARGQIDGVQCVDMLIDTGASCSFVRRSWAESVKLPMTLLAKRVTVTLADRRTAVSTHEVRVGSMCVHGSKAACTLLVMDELSNDVIVGLSWQRAARLAITPGHPYDLLNGQPVRSTEAVVSPKQQGTKPQQLPVPSTQVPVERIKLCAALVHALAAAPRPSQAERLANVEEHIADDEGSQL